MKLKYEFETTELGDQIIAVPVGENATDFKGVITLNEYGAAILNRMKEETTVDKIVDSLLEEFDGTREELSAYVEKFAEKLRSEELLDA